MNDGDIFPSFFYSRDPLDEKLDLLTLKDGPQKQFYWMLSVENESKPEQKLAGRATLAPYEDNESELIDCCDLEDNYEINPTKSGKYITSFYVPASLLPVIIGPRGLKLRELQENTNTLIKVPKPNEPPIVKITGHSERSVASARTQISLLLLAKRERLAITHFVSIPVLSDEIKANFIKFKNSILNGASTRGVDETVFQKPEKFHLTIVTLTLLDEKEVEEAKALFKKCQDSVKRIFGSKKRSITLQGVEIMNDDPADVDVLYGKVCLGESEETEKFQELVDEIVESFYRNGFVRKQYDRVKLHVTLMNSIFRKTDEFQKVEKSAGKRESFDASYILQKFRDFYFGKLVFGKIDLSIRFTASKVNGYYEAAAVLSL